MLSNLPDSPGSGFRYAYGAPGELSVSLKTFTADNTRWKTRLSPPHVNTDAGLAENQRESTALGS